ncbi:sigma-70 family RNA polymerase sigma factor [Streptomyces sp. NPDC058375]|uniref:sigma-70 family RNA polymerase sigma factor n=1 Tax=Streptomyces sp. NPDC058375 TaxID=3346467 RepID=UPI00365EE897
MQAASGHERRSGEDPSPPQQGFRKLRELPPGRQRDRLRSELVCAWPAMAHRIASRFRDRGEAMDDLRQVAAMGLAKAVDRYDPQRSEAFETYAVPTVAGELKRHFRDHTRDVHVPRRIQDLRDRVRTTRRDLIQAEGGPRSPTGAQIELAERERLILYVRSFGDLTQRAIAERLGLSRMHVSRLLHQPCGRLRLDVPHQAA